MTNMNDSETKGQYKTYYATWRGMMQRCYNRTCSQYKGYGGRGIYVHRRWHRFENFVSDMAPKPPGTSIDRIDNNGPYSKANCRWATDKQQQQNRRDNRRITFNGETLCLTEWARRLGVPRESLRKRLNLGWSIGDAITKKVAFNMKRKLTEDDVRNIRKTASSNVSASEIAKRYNLHFSMVHKIINRSTWKNV